VTNEGTIVHENEQEKEQNLGNEGTIVHEKGEKIGKQEGKNV
jgi:hypothetical protein